MQQPDRLQTTKPAAATRAKAVVVRTRPADAPARIAGDTIVKTRAPEAEPELMAPPKGASGFVKTLWNLMFGNTENKWFQIKVNLIHFKDLLLGLMQALQAGPLSPLFTITDKIGAFLAGGTARLQVAATEGGMVGRALSALGRIAAPVAQVGKVAFKWLERGAPVFGMLVAVQDLYKAAMMQGDDKISGDRKVMAWATFAFSAIGATASTVAAWSAVGAAIAVPLGIGSVGLGTIAIACFALSLLTGWLGTRLAKEQAGTTAKTPAKPAKALAPARA